MKKIILLFIAFCLTLTTFIACGNTPSKYTDGTYRAEFLNYDDRGYKDFLEIVVQNGVVSDITFDAINSDGQLRTENEEYAKAMEEMQATTPEQYSSDLENQYMAHGNIDEVVAVAGATLSSDNFKLLFTALESSLTTGNSQTVIVDPSTK